MDPADDTVDYEGEYTVTCNTGYTVSASGSMTCQADGTLDVTHTCDSKYVSHEIVFPVTFITPTSRRFQGTFYQLSILRHRLQYLSKRTS